MQPVLAVFAGYTLKKDYIEPGTALQGFVDEALQEIEYVTGDANTTWGAQRARDGHPEPFPLHYVEIGNEDTYDRSGSYNGRFAQFYDAIKAKYPKLQVIATTSVKSRVPDVIDEHFYRSNLQMEGDTTHYDNYSRSGPKIFVGEWATRTMAGAGPKVGVTSSRLPGSPTPNLGEALSDAAWLTGLERNSDLVIMHCYAPLFINVNPGARQWTPDLIGYDSLDSYGSPSYYVQQMFSTHLGSKVVPIKAQNVPMQLSYPNKNDPTGVNIPTLFEVATREGNRVYLKVVNTAGAPQDVQIAMHGVKGVTAEGTSIVLASQSPQDTNTIGERSEIVPVTSKIEGLAASFSRTFASYSVTILQIDIQ